MVYVKGFQKLSKIISYLSIIFLFAVPILIDFLDLPYELVDMGIMFLIPNLILTLFYLFDNQFDKRFIALSPKYLKCFPYNFRHGVIQELKLVLNQTHYILLLVANFFLVFYLSSIKTSLMIVLLVAIINSISLLIMLVILVAIKHQFNQYKILLHILNFQFVLFFLPIVFDNSFTSWYLSIGNLISYHIAFGPSLIHMIIFICLLLGALLFFNKKLFSICKRLSRNRH